MRNSFLVAVIIMIAGPTIWFCASNPEKAATEQAQDVCLAPARIKPKDTLPDYKKQQPEFYGNNGFKWKRTDSLNVYFFDGEDDLKESVLKIASEWSKYTAIKFRIVYDKPSSQIRVAFDKAKEFSSLIGNEALQEKYRDKPTVHLYDIGKFQFTEPVRFRRIVLHEFGHVMGLEHEIKNPDAKIPWDTAAVIKYYKEHINWDTPTVKKNIFEKAKDSYNSKYDPGSIMIYAIPDTLLKDKSYKTEWSNELSAIDKSYVSKWYKK